jgi:hypothetical protein
MRARVHSQWLLVTPRGPCLFRGPLEVTDEEAVTQSLPSLLSMESPQIQESPRFLSREFRSDLN